MKKIAVFGKPGSGKSTLSKRLSMETGITLHQLDSLVYKQNGDRVERSVYDQAHEQIMSNDSRIIDGFGPIDSFYRRLSVADTLVYIDLPYPVCYWLVTKRLLKGLLMTPEGWPEGSSIIKGSIESYKVLRLCPKFWNDAFLQKLQQSSVKQSLFVITSMTELNRFSLS